MNRFSIKNHVFGDLTEYSIVNNKTGEKVTIVSDFGCNTRELILATSHELHSIIKGHNFAAKLKKKYSTCAQLSPFVSRVRDGKYTFSGQKHQLEINKEKEHNAIHGLVYNQIFNLKKKEIKKNHAKLIFEKEIKDNEFKGYPFNLIITKEFILQEKAGLTIKTTIKNLSKSSAPLGDGWHPLLTFNSEEIDDYKLSIPASYEYTNDERGIVDKKRKVNPKNNFKRLKKINDSEFDTCYTDLNFKNHISEAVFSGKVFNTILWQTDSYPFLQIYSPPDRKSIAIEPLTSSADAFNNKNGLIVLKPEEEFTGEYGIYIVPHHN